MLVRLGSGSDDLQIPQDPEYYDYMKCYSPVDNVGANGTAYPHILVTAGLHDPRVCVAFTTVHNVLSLLMLLRPHS